MAPADRILRVAAFAVLAAARLAATTYFVAPAGSDTGAGSLDAPWKTLSHAASIAVAGDTVQVRGGIYAERVVFPRSGSAGSPIVFRAHAGETPILDGSSFTVASGWYPLLTLANRSHVTIQGFELRGLRTAQKDRVPIGILVHGSGNGVSLLDNHIHDLGTAYAGTSGGDAHGIAVYGDSATPITGLVIRGNRLHDLLLGSSEALVLNGNVSGFLVESNLVHDCNNIGIDAIGHEGTCPDPAQDAAREGIIRLNTVHSITSYGNPAYGNNYSAGGIYVDGGRDILVERNTLRLCDIGIELASEHAGRSTARIRLRNNLIHRNRIGGLFLGGYDTRRGSTEACSIEHNTFFENDTLQYDNGEICLQYDVRTTSFRHNLIVANSQGLIIGNAYAQNTANTLDYNLVHTVVTPRWRWKNVNRSGWAAWRSASAQDGNSIFTAPLLLDPVGGDFNLRAKSPAIDAGDPSFVPDTVETDHAGRPRVREGRTDIGAFEFDLAGFAAGGVPEPLDLSLASSEARLTFRRRTDWNAQSLAFRIQTSTDIVSGWTDAINATALPPVPVAPADGTERVT